MTLPKCAKCGNPSHSFSIVTRSYGGTKYKYKRFVHYKFNATNRAKAILMPRLSTILGIIESDAEPKMKLERINGFVHRCMINVSMNARRRYCYERIKII